MAAGVYVNVPSLFSVTVPLVGAASSVTPLTFVSLAIRPLPGSDTTIGLPAGTSELKMSARATAAVNAAAPGSPVPLTLM